MSLQKEWQQKRNDNEVWCPSSNSQLQNYANKSHQCWGQRQNRKKEKYRQKKKLLFPLFPLPRSPVKLTTSPLLSLSPGPLYSRLCGSPFSLLPYSSEGYSILKEILLVFGSAPFQRAESLASVLPHPPSSYRSPSPSCPVPRGPPLFSGLARVEQCQSGARREQTRVSFTAFLQQRGHGLPQCTPSTLMSASIRRT